MAVELAVTNLTVMGPCSGSDADVETSKCSPSLILEIPTTSAIPTPHARDEKKQRERLHPAGQARLEANSMSTLTRSSASMSSSTTSSSTSTATSPSSTTTADTSVASDTHHFNYVHDKDPQEQYTDVARRNVERNDARTTNESILEAKPDTDIGHPHPVNMNTGTTISSTPESATASPSTVASSSSSSSTSLPATSPSPSISSSTSATNLNDHNVDSNGILSLLRPRFQSNPNLNVKFAPLPELAPRKRKSSTPLGMAARSQLAQRRKMMYRDGYDYEGDYDDRQRRYHYSTSQDISEEEGEADHGGPRKKKGKKKAAAKVQEQDEERKKKSKEEDDLEQMPGDPFVSLAKKMGKLWKKVAQSKKGEKGDMGEENGQSGDVSVVAPAKGEEELQSASERQGGGSRDEEPNTGGPVDLEAVASGCELSPPPPRPSSLDQAAETSIVEKEEEEEGKKTISKAEAPELDGKVAVSPAPVLNPTPVS